MTSPRLRSVALGLALAVFLTAESSAQAPRPGAAHARDVLVLRRGEIKEGALQGRTARDFLRVMPGYMPERTLVLGCLERPDQTQAHGAYGFPGNDPSPWPEVPQITIKWSFTRRRP